MKFRILCDKIEQKEKGHLEKAPFFATILQGLR